MIARSGQVGSSVVLELLVKTINLFPEAFPVTLIGDSCRHLYHFSIMDIVTFTQADGLQGRERASPDGARAAGSACR